MRIYLAARYSRRLELCGYREQLQAAFFDVQSRWLDGNHQLSDKGIPIGNDGEALVEGDAAGIEHAQLRAKFARDDWEDVTAAQLVISFTEPPRSGASRGGRHVEFGIAMGRAINNIIVGHRENIFHWLPGIVFFPTWEQALVYVIQTYSAQP